MWVDVVKPNGVVLKSRGKRPDDLSIRWLDGSVSVVSELSVSDFRRLVADHEKKLATHQATLARLEALR